MNKAFITNLRRFCVTNSVNEITLQVDGTTYHYLNLDKEFQFHKDGDAPTNYKSVHYV